MNHKLKAGRQIKVRVSLRLDKDLVAWLRNSGSGWQSRVNVLLRAAAGLKE